jgi:predicted transposase YbfD/YdcC
VEPISPVTAGLPGARCAITVQRDWCEKKAPQTLKSNTRVFLSSLSVKENKARSTQAVRGHWSIENRNHHKRDASAWQEDRHKHRRPKAALNLALTRNALLVSGVLGNLTDRILHGYVIDFLDFILPWYGQWPAFNVADSAICAAAALFFISGFRRSDETA